MCCRSSGAWKPTTEAMTNSAAAEGPLRVTNPEPRDPLFATLIKAAGEVGIPHNPDYNGATQDGIAMSQATIASGRRMSTARCYLDRSVRERICISKPERWRGRSYSTANVALACCIRWATSNARRVCLGKSWSAAERSTRRNC